MIPVVLDPKNGDKVNTVVMKCLGLIDRAVAINADRGEVIEILEGWLSPAATECSVGHAGEQLRTVLNVLREVLARHTQREEIMADVRLWVAEIRAEHQRIMS